MMLHRKRFIRSIYELTEPCVRCGTCGLRTATVVGMATGRNMDHVTTEAFCTTCGYQTIYFSVPKERAYAVASGCAPVAMCDVAAPDV